MRFLPDRAGTAFPRRGEEPLARALVQARFVAFIALLLLLPTLGFGNPPYWGRSTKLPADAALVLSGDVDYLRVRRAAALYHEGLVKMIALTGAGVGGDSAVEMRKEALALGVPAEAIVLETESTSTRENITAVAPLIRARGWRRIALVTSESHMLRALGAARKVMPEVAWIPVPVEDAGPPERVYRTRFQEWGKLLWYAVRGWV